MQEVCGDCGAVYQGKCCPVCTAAKLKESNAARAIRFRNKHSEAGAQRTKEWRLRHPEKNRENHLKDNYGITLEDYELMVIQQENRCAICGGKESGNPSGRWSIDHNHKTQKIRALLCHACNALLGQAREDTSILKAAIAYLERHTV